MPRPKKPDPPKPSVTDIRARRPLTADRDPDPLECCNVCHLTSKQLGAWREHDEWDKPVPGDGALVFIGQDHPVCLRIMENHPRLYSKEEGLPGWFPLLCGRCRHRDGLACRHPDLRANGGKGLRAEPDVVHVCARPRSKSFTGRNWVRCEGFEQVAPVVPADAPMVLPSDRYVVRAVLDDQTCPTCRDNDGCDLLVPAGTAPAVKHCEHVAANDGRACRCTFEAVPR